MAYLHCHSCDWQQDDFYSVEGYNPASYLQGWMKALCEDDLAKVFSESGVTLKEGIAREFEKYANRIRKMKWITFEQWKTDKVNAVCPKCGAKDFDID